MDSGIHADQNFYSRPSHPHSPEHNPQRTYRSFNQAPPLPNFEAQSPQVPSKLPFLTTENLRAASSTTSHGTAGLKEELDQEPDDFYRDYRGVQQASSSFAEITPTNMAATMSESRPQPSSLRSNGNGKTPKNPPLLAARIAPKTSYRSASSPLDNQTALGNAKLTPAFPNARQHSVKDLAKRFDPSNEQSGSTARKPTPRINTRDVSGPGYMKDRTGFQSSRSNTSSPAGSVKAGSATRDNGSSGKFPSQSKTTQRARFTPEDQLSSNVLSTAARKPTTRPAATGTNTLASKSTGNLPPTSPEAPPQTQARRPLFGEVTAAGQGTSDIAYGIPQTPARRSSTANLKPTHRRSKSNLDVSPSSPTAWYLGVAPTLDDVEPNKASRAQPPPSPAHNRSHSDSADSHVNIMVGVSPSFQPPHSPLHPPAHSRLPLPSRLSNSSDSSLPSTRGSSPQTARPITNGKVRRPEQRAWSPAGAAGATSSAEKTPTRSPPRRKGRTPEKLPLNTAPLKAYISSIPAKSSPPLRSSRPRMNVAAATTSSSRQKVADSSDSPRQSASSIASRQKAADRSGSPQRVRTGMKITRKPEAQEQKPRKIPDLPLSKVDFKERRERIQRAYTKSIHEHEQRGIRAANTKRMKEGEKGRESIASTDVDVDVDVDVVDVDAAPKPTPKEKESPLPKVETEEKPNTPPPPLRITTSFHDTHPAHDDAPQDSPTLGMPGAFVDDDDEIPQSAISHATGVTEIENEPQTEPGLSREISVKHLAPSGLSSHIGYLEDQLSPEQALFGMQYLDADSPVEAEEESIHIMLDPASVEEAQPESTPTNDAFDHNTATKVLTTPDLSVPGAFQAEEQRSQPVFAATLTCSSPEEVTHFLPAILTPPESAVEHLPNAVEAEKKDNITVDIPVQLQSTPEIAFPDEVDCSHTPEPVDLPSFSLPMIHTALAPPSVCSDEAHDYLHTPVTDMEYDSSDGLPVVDTSEQENHDDEQNHLSGEPNRSSHVSSWTNYSVESIDEQYEAEEYSRSSIATSSDPEKKPTPPPKETSPALPPKPDGYSPAPSPRFRADLPLLSGSLRHQLPPLAIGDGFGLGLDRPSFISSSVPLWAPDHSPPPPPTAAAHQSDSASASSTSHTPPPVSIYNRRPASSLYQSSQNGVGQNNESRRASDDFYSPRPSSSTPRSSTQISFDEATPEATSKPPEAPEPVLTEEEKKAAEKERKRLFQRKMVIKELIDTESVYLKDMNVVEEIYKGTAEACPKLDANDIKTIFRNTEEIVAFSTMFLDELKVSAATIYSPRSLKKTRTTTTSTPSSNVSPTDERLSIAVTLSEETDDHKDKRTFVGANFGKHLKRMQVIYTDYLKNSEVASVRLATLQKDGAVKVWLTECNTVAKDITQAWDLDALLVKPVQRITRYQLLLTQIKEATPTEHPDYDALEATRTELSKLLQNIDDMKKRIHMVGKIVGRKRKETDARSGLAKAFARRTDKLQSSNPNRPQDDEVYVHAHEKFSDDYLRLQVVLRDFQFYTRQTEIFANDWLRQLSSMELVMRMSASPYPEIESKWARFNMSMRDIGTVVLDAHITSVQKKVIEPLEQIIAMYNPPNLAMKKRTKRRLDYEKYLALNAQNKKIDDKLLEQIAQYEALNETLKLELPTLSAKTHLLGNLVISQFVKIQVAWWDIWQQKVRIVLEDGQMAKDVPQIVEMFYRDYRYAEARIHELGIINGTFGPMSVDRSSTRDSQSTQEDELTKTKSRPSNLSSRGRGLSVTSDKSPSIPAPDFTKRLSGQFTFSPIIAGGPGITQFIYQQQPSYPNGHSRAGSGSPATPDITNTRPAQASGRPSTGRSHTSDNGMRMSNDYNSSYRRESGSTYNSTHHVDGPPLSTRPYSGLFHSAMPMNDGPEDSQRSSRASSRDRGTSGGFNVLYLAASLFEFNISATKTEAGYPYLTYQAGEIFDVIGEKGELWLAKNQDDPDNEVGWIWSKHFARLATD